MGFEIINVLKKEKGLTNAQIAKMSGITLSTLDKITSGVNTNPKLDTLQAICKVLGCTLDDFADPAIRTEKSPDVAEAAPGEDISEIFNYLQSSLVSSGLLKEGQDLTDRQADVLVAVCKIIRATFND